MLGTNHPDYAIVVNNLASLYEDMNRFSEAEPLYLEALKIMKNVYGADHQSYAIVVANLAELYRKADNFAKAEILIKES